MKTSRNFIIYRNYVKVFLSLLLFLAVTYVTRSQSYEYPFQNPALRVDDRVEDLVSRMTVEEKIGQMIDAAPALERLGIPEYNWWNECLHGVGRAGLATVFPQAVGLGATWDKDLIFRVSTLISDEARAKHHEAVRNDSRRRYEGLTFWTPNINIFRDPRWGRGQETYGEDPYLTGKLGVQFVKGLQGDDPRYFKTIATLKHFAVHSGPEPERHSFDAVTDKRDFMETYLPQFEMGIKEGKAYSVMCAYNRYMGEACCGSDMLLNGILRTEWGFDGYVVSDCWAIDDLFGGHELVETAAEAASLSVRSGTDLECGSAYLNLTESLEKGMITEEDIDVAIKRLFVARFKLGMFDPPEMVSYTRIPYEVVDSEAHKKLAKETTLKSIVLLKNEDNMLPLKKDIGKVAVIGPNSDEEFVLLGNYNGDPSDPITPLRGITEKLAGQSEVTYLRGAPWVKGMPDYEVIPVDVLTNEAGTKGLMADYYNNRDFVGDILFSTSGENIDADWGDKAPRDNMDADNFGVIWTGELVPELSGLYQLGFISSCKTEIYVNDSVVLRSPANSWDERGNPRMRNTNQPILLEAGEKYSLRVEAGEVSGNARVQLLWALPEDILIEKMRKEAVEAAAEADVVIMCMGITPRLEGEEMRVDIEGFNGGDRTDIILPVVQQDLIKAVHATGKPVVLVLLNGSALAINWEKENIPAILEAWYPGQAGGEAIADILFGDYNPAGRLPVTFYKSVKDLPPFEDYNMKERTYRYFTGEPLYPFGYGLSYTTFEYSDLQIEQNHNIGDTVHLSVNLKNSGGMAGDEVVQLYVSDISSPYTVPLRSLCAFERINLAPGESRKLSLSVSPDAFSVINDDFERVIEPGKFIITVGGHQPVLRNDNPEAGLLKAEVTVK